MQADILCLFSCLFMILLSLSWGVSFFSPCCFKGPPEPPAFNFANAEEALWMGKREQQLKK